MSTIFFRGTWRKRKDKALTGKLKKKGVITNSKAVAMVNTEEIAQAGKVSKRAPKKSALHVTLTPGCRIGLLSPISFD